MMSTRFHVCITLGTRPEAIKLAPVIHLFRNNPQFQTSVILTGQHREMVAQVMQLFELEADYDLGIMQPKQTLTQITCNSLMGLEKLYQEIQPNIVLVQGDTTTAFAAALAAVYQQIPVGHVEAGLRTDNLFNPFLKVSGVKEGIHHTGNTVIDALLYVSGRSPECAIAGLDWSAQRVILATVHRRENWGEPLAQIMEAWLQILTDFPDVALVLPMHLNPVVREPLIAKLGNHPRIFLIEPLDYEQLVGAMQRCYLIMSDSGGLQEEAPSLGKPVLVLRSTTERPEAIAAGTSKLVGTETKDIVAAATKLLSDRAAYEEMANVANPFGDGQSSQRILEIVQSFL